MVGTSEINENVSFTLKETNLAFIIDSGENNLCRIKANDKNKLGSVELIAEYQGIEYNIQYKYWYWGHYHDDRTTFISKTSQMQKMMFSAVEEIFVEAK